MKTENLLTEIELAKYLRISIRTLQSYRSIRKYKGMGPPYIKFGRSVRYNPEQIQKWIKDKKKL